MKYNERDEGDYKVVEMSGNVDLSVSPDARKQILSCLENSSVGVLVDMSQVSYIDSSGIASLVEGYQTAEKNNVNFGLLGVSDAAMNVLQLARLHKVFPIHDSVDARVQEDS